MINPRPKFTSDVILHEEKMKRLFEDNIMNSHDEFEVGTNAVYTQGSKVFI